MARSHLQATCIHVQTSPFTYRFATQVTLDDGMRVCRLFKLTDKNWGWVCAWNARVMGDGYPVRVNESEGE